MQYAGLQGADVVHCMAREYNIKTLERLRWMSQSTTSAYDTIGHKDGDSFIVPPHNFCQMSYKYVSLEHLSSLKSLGYICSNSQQYIVWVKIIDFSLMPKIISILR